MLSYSINQKFADNSSTFTIIGVSPFPERIDNIEFLYMYFMEVTNKDGDRTYTVVSEAYIKEYLYHIEEVACRQQPITKVTGL